MSEFQGIHQGRLKVRFLRPKGKISRRELLKLVVPHYEVIPFVEPTLCHGSKECGLCQDTCSLKAVTASAAETVIDTTLCNGCGACIAICPQRAIVYPPYSLEQLDKEMEGLPIAEDTLPEPGIIAFVCQNCLPAADEDRAGLPVYPSNVLSIKISCLAMASPWLMLRAFDRGAQGLAFISCRSKCPDSFDVNRWQENIRFVQELLTCWGIEPERLKAFDATEEDSGNVTLELDRFTRELAGLGPVPLRVSEATLIPDDGLLLPALIKGLEDKLEGSSKGTVTDGMVPFGKLELDSAQCTGCGLCALDCPVEALEASSDEETDSYQLLFRHDRCVACDRCIEACPEQCLSLQRILELDKINNPAAVLFEDSIARCRECGTSIGSRGLIDRLRVKAQVMGELLADQFELCHLCKTRQFGLPQRR